MTTPQSQISTHLQTNKSLHVSPTWLHSFITSSTTLQRNTPLSALTQTALFRILASDFRDSLTTSTPSSLLPADIFDPTVQERRLPGPVAVQVLDIEDIGTSLWSQVEAIERVARGEAIRGREIVRTVNVGEEGEDGGVARGPDTAAGGTSPGPHRLILQDAAGTRAVGVEVRRVSGVALNRMAIGAKMVLRNVTVARGMVLLTPECVTLLGGKIEALDQAWREARKAKLLARITAGPNGQNGQ
ncbi:putative RecQ-mediated genome instability protein [Aspergillus heteromorphus CBS 117.55]|uniref:RecQ-mediated genome instability protein 1 n=1 Tax=Aspergillus heteromorphus CBS 117.55 TaxID=1448321 RepID=A0A317X3F3_9EURO|nr:putative RecQ-mediated genome instability protein [Aspergillus heteromorphus CBS 117.55]PWY92681.1 putative RecQ-mediated genome instability protein [Aspergillus heteromorphus CBS 117.55]